MYTSDVCILRIVVSYGSDHVRQMYPTPYTQNSNKKSEKKYYNGIKYMLSTKPFISLRFIILLKAIRNCLKALVNIQEY
jgi:hypothetical protein